MEKRLLFTATVTGKRQITIPKDLCDILNIENGNQVIFKEEGNKIIFEVEQEYEKCFGCNGSNKIKEKECFICKGSGKLEKCVTKDIYKLIGIISISSAEYGVEMSFIQKEYPIIELTSSNYSLKELERIQCEIQNLIINQLVKKN